MHDSIKIDKLKKEKLELYKIYEKFHPVIFIKLENSRVDGGKNEALLSSRVDFESPLRWVYVTPVENHWSR